MAKYDPRIAKRTRTSVLGPDYAAQSVGPEPFVKAFEEVTMQTVWAGVWARKQIEDDKAMGKEIGLKFAKYDIDRVRRRRRRDGTGRTTAKVAASMEASVSPSRGNHREPAHGMKSSRRPERS